MKNRLQELAKGSIASQDWFELWQLLEILERLDPIRIVEVGVHRGGMIKTLHDAFPSAQIVGVDIDFKPLEFDTFIQVEGNSNDPAVRDRALKPQEYRIDFLFIDGDHNFDAAMKDYELYAPYVRPGGIIALHDINRDPDRVPHHAGVDCRRVFDELKKRHASIEIWNGTAGDDGPGIGVLFV